MPRMKAAARPTEHDAALAQHRPADPRGAPPCRPDAAAAGGERYTKAYVSALETGIARPSMVALSYLSERLGLPPSHFLDEQTPAGRGWKSTCAWPPASGRPPPMATRPC